MKIMLIILALLIISATVNSLITAKQMQPDSKRVKQIQAALVEHGYTPGKTWGDTQEILRCIAGDHGWQIIHAPDARVLILLGLGNKDSDPAVALAGRNHLDGPEKP
jgi:hypothetical protein